MSHKLRRDEYTKYYMYRHIRQDKDEVFYIGIGIKRLYHSGTIKSEYERAFIKKGRSLYWKRITNKSKYSVDILWECDNRLEIIKKEVEFIALYGRRDKKEGSLANLTDGGEGTNNMTYSKERNQKISESLKGKIRSQETFKKISEAKKKKVMQYTINGEFVKEWNSMSEAADYYKINASNITIVIKNNRKNGKKSYTAAGYKWKYKSV